jgi:hypothetical protein
MNVLATLLQTIALVPSVVNGNRGPIQPPDRNEKKGCICRLQNASCSLHFCVSVACALSPKMPVREIRTRPQSRHGQ